MDIFAAEILRSAVKTERTNKVIVLGLFGNNKFACFPVSKNAISLKILS